MNVSRFNACGLTAFINQMSHQDVPSLNSIEFTGGFHI